PCSCEKSKSSRTSGGRVVRVLSITRLHLIITFPLTLTAPLGSLTVPLVLIVMLLSTVLAPGVVWAWTEGLPRTSTATTPTRSVTRIGLNRRRRVLMFSSVFMCFSFSVASKSSRKYVSRGHKRDALRCRSRSRQRSQEWRATIVDLPPQEHRVVFVHGVVAVLHEHAAKVAELECDSHFAARSQAPDVLAPALPGRNVSSTSVASQSLALLEVNMNRVIPATTTVFQCPYLSGTETWRRRDTAKVGCERSSLVVSFNTPWPEERRHGVVGCLISAAVEFEDTFTSHGNSRQVRIRNQRGGHLTYIGLCGVACYAELEESSDTRIRRVA